METRIFGKTGANITFITIKNLGLFKSFHFYHCLVGEIWFCSLCICAYLAMRDFTLLRQYQYQGLIPLLTW